MNPKAPGLVLTIGIGGHDKLFKSCVDSHRAYAARNGFSHVVVNSAPRKLEGAEASWLKAWLIPMAMNAGYEWVAYVDADCEIRPHAPCLANDPSFQDPDKSIFLAPGMSGRFNAGVIIVRDAQPTRDFFQAVMDNANRGVPKRDRAPYENGHVIHFARRNERAVGTLAHRLWNNNSTLDPESFIQHFSTGPLRDHYFATIGHQPKRLTLSQRVARKWRRLVNRDHATIRERISALSSYYPNAYPNYFCALKATRQVA